MAGRRFAVEAKSMATLSLSLSFCVCVCVLSSTKMSTSKTAEKERGGRELRRELENDRERESSSVALWIHSKQEAPNVGLVDLEGGGEAFCHIAEPPILLTASGNVFSSLSLSRLFFSCSFICIHTYIHFFFSSAESFIFTRLRDSTPERRRRLCLTVRY